MSKRKDFHNFIEEQSPAEKESAWRRLESELGDEQTSVSPKKRRSSMRMKVLSACASFAVIAVIGLGIGLGLNSNVGGDDVSDGNPLEENPPSQTMPVEPVAPDDDIRYCGVNDYVVETGELTLKQYAEQYQINLLYLDWYDETEDYNNYLYKLKENDEIICLQEDLVDDESNYICLYITDNRTETDFLYWHDAEAEAEKVINGISVYYMYDEQAWLNFEYQGYKYYLLFDFDDKEYLFSVAEQMILNNI